MPDTDTVPPSHTRSFAWPSFVHSLGAAVAFGLLVGLVLVGLASPDAGHSESPADATPVADAPEPAAPQSVEPVAFDVELGDLYIKPAAIDVPAGAPIVLNVTNVGSQEHNLGIEGEEGTPIAAGQATVLNWGPLTESTPAWCTIAGHKEAGMVLQVNVVGAESADTPTATGDGDPAADDTATAAVIDPTATPAADWQPYDPTVQPADGGTTHEVELHVTEQDIEVAPGVVQQLWTYNGTAPGPVLRGKVGDVFKVTIVNDATMAHSIDFHASKVAPNVEMRPIPPGESLVYQFQAEFAGVFSYHCGVAPMIHHMGNGMFGAVIVDPPDLAPVDKEFVFIQSELNLGAPGEVMDLNKMMAGENDAVVFNGYHNQYVHRPLQVEPTDRIRAWVVNAAINEDLSFHVVGSIFDTVWKEGSYVLRAGNPEHGGAQALDLATTQGGFVEFSLETPGQYTFVGHQMRNLSRGAAGVIVSGDGGEGEAHG